MSLQHYLRLVESAVRLDETYQLLTRDTRGNYVAGEADAIMADIDIPKTVTLATIGRKLTTSLVVSRSSQSKLPDASVAVSLRDGSATYQEQYYGQIIPICRYILNRWPAYGAFILGDSEMTLDALARWPRPSLATHTEWYHGTTSITLPIIQRFGLRPQNDVDKRNYSGLNGSESDRVYLTSEIEAARDHAGRAARKFGGSPVVLSVDLSGLEAGIRDDHDVRTTTIASHPPIDLGGQRMRRRPGQASLLTIGTIAYSGRIPATRLAVIWQGKPVTGKLQKNASTYTFLAALSAAVTKLDRRDLSGLFYIIGAKPQGRIGQQVSYPKSYYAAPDKLVYSVGEDKQESARYAQWLRGMMRRIGSWQVRDFQAKHVIELIQREANQHLDVTSPPSRV